MQLAETIPAQRHASFQLEDTIPAKAQRFFPGNPIVAVELTSNDHRVEKTGGIFRIENTALIGRHPDCDIVILEPGVSRKHARIYRKDEQLFLTDENSTNGTYWNGKPISQIPISEDGELQIYDVFFSVKVIL